jgi:hypothetical protein
MLTWASRIRWLQQKHPLLEPVLRADSESLCTGLETRPGGVAFEFIPSLEV